MPLDSAFISSLISIGMLGLEESDRASRNDACNGVEERILVNLCFGNNVGALLNVCDRDESCTSTDMLVVDEEGVRADVGDALHSVGTSLMANTFSADNALIYHCAPGGPHSKGPHSKGPHSKNLR